MVDIVFRCGGPHNSGLFFLCVSVVIVSIVHVLLLVNNCQYYILIIDLHGSYYSLPHYKCGVQVQQTHIDNETHRFCSWAASNSILRLMKYMGMSLLINM